MCTVSFISEKNNVFITHSRDEMIARSPALAPEIYPVNNKHLLFPRDGLAGGSWIGVNETGTAAALLNGAFIKHIPHPPYRKSRGLIFLDLLSSDNILNWTLRLIALLSSLLIWYSNEIHLSTSISRLSFIQNCLIFILCAVGNANPVFVL